MNQVRGNSPDDWNLMDPAVQQCPYDFCRTTRQQAPVYRMPQSGYYLLTSFDLCREVIRKLDLFSSGEPDGAA